MWIIESGNKTVGIKYYLLPERCYTVGRKDCDVLVLGDPAISRKHASFITSTTVQNPNVPIPRCVLQLEDLSKFGTFVNEQKMTNGQKLQLNEGDVIKFGSEKSTFTVAHEDLVVTTSCLDTNMKKSVKALLKRLGGCLVSEWNKYCDLVIMGNLSVTIKVICALIMGKPIMTPEYLVQLHKSIENKTDRPKPKLFLPSLAESQLNPDEVCFDDVPARRQLFTGMTFVFLTSKQYQKLQSAIQLAGGTAILMERGAESSEEVLAEENTVVMLSEHGESQISQMSPNVQQWVNKVLDILKSHNRRPIPEAELGYAVLYCSVQKYCNPAIVPQADHYPVTVAASVPVPVTSQPGRNLVSQYLQGADEKVIEPPQAAGETSRSTVQETELRSEMDGSSRIDGSRKRGRETKETSPSLPPSKLSKPTTSATSEPSDIKTNTSPTPIAIESGLATDSHSVAMATERTIKKELLSQSAELFTAHPSTVNAKTPRIFGSADYIFAEESDFTNADRSHCGDIFASPVIEPMKGPSKSTVSVDDEFDTVRGSSRRNRLDTRQNTRRDTPSASAAESRTSTQNRRQRADDNDVDEFDAVTSSRKRRRQTQTQATQPRMKVVQSDLLLLDTDPIVELVPSIDKKPVVSDLDEGEFLHAKRAPENPKVKREPAMMDTEEASQREEAKNCCNVTSVNLLRRQPKSAVRAAEFNTWKGKQVKNFKKFRKTGTHQSQGDEDVVRLPRIIGGRDLLPHKTLKQNAMMQKFAKELEEQNSQQDHLDKDVSSLFDAIPTRRVVKKGRM